MKRVLVVGLILIIAAIVWSCTTTMIQNMTWTECEFSQSFMDNFDMEIFTCQVAMMKYVGSDQYSAELFTDLGGVYRVWNIILPQSERHHATMSVIEISAGKTVPETEYRILVTRNPKQISNPDFDPDFLTKVKQARVCCIASIVALYGQVNITTYGDTVEECITYIENFLLETFHD